MIKKEKGRKGSCPLCAPDWEIFRRCKEIRITSAPCTRNIEKSIPGENNSTFYLLILEKVTTFAPVFTSEAQAAGQGEWVERPIYIKKRTKRESIINLKR